VLEFCMFSTSCFTACH